MSFYMQKDGCRLLAGIIAGSGKKVNGMYVEYSDSDVTVGDRSHSWYDLHKDVGYMRIPITNAHVDENNVINFTGYLADSDMPKDMTGSTCIRCITLVSLGDAQDTDTFVCTVSLKNPLRLLDNTYIVLHASMKLGDVK